MTFSEWKGGTYCPSIRWTLGDLAAGGPPQTPRLTRRGPAADPHTNPPGPPQTPRLTRRAAADHHD